MWACGQTVNIFVTQLLGNLKVVLTSLWLPWQQVSSTKRTSNFQIWQSRWPNLFIALLESTLNSLTPLEILQKLSSRSNPCVISKKAFFSLTENSTGWISPSKRGPSSSLAPSQFYLRWHTECGMHAKIKIGHCVKFRDNDKCFLHWAFISGSCNFTLHFHFRCSVHATFDRHFASFSWYVHLSCDVGGLHAPRWNYSNCLVSELNQALMNGWVRLSSAIKHNRTKKIVRVRFLNPIELNRTVQTTSRNRQEFWKSFLACKNNN